MSDLLKRLRQAEDSKTYVSEGDLWNLCGEAADEIERLRERQTMKRFEDFDFFCIALIIVLMVSMAFAKWANQQELVYFEVERNFMELA